MTRTKGKTRKTKKSSGDEANAPHDGLFHLAFSVPQNAASHLQLLLPKDVVSRIRWETMRLASGTYTDAKLTKRISDVLFEVEIDSEQAFVYVLYEHKSAPELWTLLQMLEYMVRIWRRYLNESSGRTRLPLILPIVLHHGSSGWTVARRFSEYYNVLPESLRPYVVDFEILLDDVGRVDPDEVLVRPMRPEATLALLTLMLGRTPQRFFVELPKWSDLLVEVLRGEGENSVAMLSLMLYLKRVADVSIEETTMALLDALKRSKMSPAEEIMNADKILRAEAIRQGRREGKREGKLEGKTETLLRQLERRFGAVSSAVVQRVQSATSTELDEMVLRVLTASTPAEVVGVQKKKSRLDGGKRR